jgi:transposase
MPKRRSVVELRDVINRLKLGQGIRRIHEQTGVHRTIIRSLRDTAEGAGWLRPEAELPSEVQIQEVRRREVPPEAAQHPLATFREDFQRWVDAGHSYVVMHQLIKDRCPCSEATLRRFVQKAFPQRRRVSLSRKTTPGAEMEVDFGYLGITYDPLSRRNRKTWLFSARLRHSRLAWREVVFHQKGPVFFLAHMHAFEYFGGVPLAAVPDNLKAAVLKASWNEPLVNRSYRQLAEHYGFLISACPPKQPRAKGGVENDVKYVKRNFWPLFLEQQRTLGREVPRYDELVSALEAWSRDVSEARIIRGVGRSPREIFETEERSCLRALPDSRWDQTTWALAKVAADFRLQFQKGFYTVPCQFVGQQVTVCGSSTMVRIFFELREIALHARVERPWQTRFNPLHAPPQMQKYLEETRPGLLQWARRLGDPVGRLAEVILEQKAVDGLRPLRALIRLADTYSPQRLSRACERALHYGTPCYASVKSILANSLDRLPTEAAVDEQGQTVFRFSRRGSDFDPEQIRESTN